MATTGNSRRSVLGDAAIELIAREGLRGLTHRGVDSLACLPTGSTSYYARTRLALLELAVARMLEHDEAQAGPTDSTVDGFATMIATFLQDAMTAGRRRTLARYELALEATRRPELRLAYDRAGARLREHAATMLASAGSTAPERHARTLVAWCDGTLFDSIAGAGSGDPPTHAELVQSAHDVLAGLLAQRDRHVAASLQAGKRQNAGP